jgi:hypothetical protein
MSTPAFAPLTKDEALTEQYFHAPADCVPASVGPRGGVTPAKPRVWRRNGQTKTWKRSPERFALPLKHGLYAYDTVTEREAHYVCPEHRCPVCNPS